MSSDEEACQYIVELIYDRTRIRLHDGKHALIRGRLGKRMRHYGFATLAEYCSYLRTHAGDDEFTLVTDALTTNHTNFLREADHFDFLIREALPSVLPPGQKRFSIWSAASSSGEEAYTIAMYLEEHFPAASGWDWRIFGSDISTKVIDKARLAIYPEDRVQGIPEQWLRKYFQRGVGKWAGNYRVKPAITERVTFSQVNLIEPYTHSRKFEVIFCRNVMIYFDRTTQRDLVQRLTQFLVPGGFLLIGHSESLNSLNLPFQCLRPSVYKLI